MKQHWYKDALFYHVYPIGFCGAPERNNFSLPPEPRLLKLAEWLPHIRALGANALYLGPVFESTAHGYDTRDFFTVDRRLGTNETLKHMVTLFHQEKIKVILDGVFNHVGRDFWAFRDVLEKGSASRFCNWFKDLHFMGTTPFGDPFSYTPWNGCYDLVTLNLEHPEVRQHLLHAVRVWITDFGIDGLRLDAADCVSLDFQRELAAFCRTIKRDFFLLGEVIHGDYNRWVNKDCLDAVTNYECYKGIYSSHNDKNYFEIAYSLNRQFGSGGIYEGLQLYSFVDNHDVNRIASQLHDRRDLSLVHCLLFTIPGIPSVYYGSEWGIEGRKLNGNDTALRPALSFSSRAGNEEIENELKRLAMIRRNSSVLKHGNYRQLYVAMQQIAFTREYNKELVLVILNASDAAVSLSLQADTLGTDGLHDSAGEFVPVHEGRISIDSLHAHSYRILYGRRK
jgi:glycosidase